MMIPQNYRDEFEQLGVFDLTKRLNAGLYDEDKRKAVRLWLDEQEHGEDRTYRAEQLKLQHRANLKTTIALILSGIAIGISIWSHLENRSATLNLQRQSHAIRLSPGEDAKVGVVGSPKPWAAVAHHPQRIAWD